MALERVPPSICPEPVDRPWYRQRWDSLTFLHWEVEPSDIQKLLPKPLVVDTFDGAAWIGLVPFEMQNVEVRLPLPRGSAHTVGVPGSRRFPETNVRTYVIGPQGRRGVWFFSLDAADPVASAAARVLHGLPYFWAEMSVDRGERTITYRSRRRLWRGEFAVTSAVSIAIGASTPGDDLDHFLTARWGLYQVRGNAVRYAPADHEPWPLHAAEVLSLDDRLIAATGLAPPEGRLLVRYSPGVDVAIGRPRRVR